MYFLVCFIVYNVCPRRSENRIFNLCVLKGSYSNFECLTVLKRNGTCRLFHAFGICTGVAATNLSNKRAKAVQIQSYCTTFSVFNRLVYFSWSILQFFFVFFRYFKIFEKVVQIPSFVNVSCDLISNMKDPRFHVTP